MHGWNSKKKGQVSIELLAIVSFMLAIFLPIIMITYFKSYQIGRSVSGIEAEGLCKRIASTASVVWHSGEGSIIRMRLMVPDNVKGIKAVIYPTGGSEIIAYVSEERNRVSEIVANVDGPVKINDDLTPGVYTVIVKNVGNYVSIEKEK